MGHLVRYGNLGIVEEMSFPPSIAIPWENSDEMGFLEDGIMNEHLLLMGS